MRRHDIKIDMDDYSRKWLEESKKDVSFEFILTEVRRKQVLSSLSKYEHKNILEIGSGLLPLFPYCDYEQYVIVEPSEEFVQYTKRLAAKKPNVLVIQGYIEDIYEELLDVGDFDFIIASSLLHEVPQPRRLLQSIFRLCKPQTVVHINCPNIYSFHRLLAYEMGLIGDISEKSKTEIDFQRHTRFDMRSLIRMVEEEGFQVLAQGTYFIKPFTNEQMEKIIANNIVSKEVITGLEHMTKYMPDMGCEMFVEVKIRDKR